MRVACVHAKSPAARSVTDRTRSLYRPARRSSSNSSEPSVADRPVRAPSSDSGQSRTRSSRDGCFLAPSEHSLRGRNTQDCRVRNELRPVRIYRSGLHRQPTIVHAGPALDVRLSAGHLLSRQCENFTAKYDPERRDFSIRRRSSFSRRRRQFSRLGPSTSVHFYHLHRFILTLYKLGRATPSN